MYEEAYDSPTFLSQKDKYFMGLSMVQMLGVVVIAFVVFFLSLTFPGGMWMRVIVVAVGTLVVSVLVFGRIAGLSIPGFVFLMVTSPMRRTVYEEDSEVLLAGSSEFLAALEAKEAREGRGEPRGDGWLARGRELVTGEETAERRGEIRADLEKGMVEGAQSLEGMLKDGIRSIKGG